MTQSKERYYSWFRDREFVKEFDEILDALPDFEKLDQCFVHKDIGPHNAMLRNNGEVVFIDLARSFLKGYYGEVGISPEEYEMLFQGAIQMHISYMQTYGPYAVDSLWSILRFGIEQKEKLYAYEETGCGIQGSDL